MTAYYRKKLKQGQEYEKYIQKIFEKINIKINVYEDKEDQYNIGETEEGYEIKFDNLYKDTHNLYIETYEKTNAEQPFWYYSGIYRDDNSFLYIIGNKKIIYVFSIKVLQELHKQKNFAEVSNLTSQGFLIPKDEAKEYVKYILEVKQKRKEKDFEIKKWYKDAIKKHNKIFK